MPENPQDKQPQPPFPGQQQEAPGLESEMQPQPDYGADSYRGAGRLKDFGQDNPTGRPAQPVELAPAYVFLASPESSFLSGEILGVTGGMQVP